MKLWSVVPSGFVFRAKSSLPLYSKSRTRNAVQPRAVERHCVYLHRILPRRTTSIGEKLGNGRMRVPETPPRNHHATAWDETPPFSGHARVPATAIGFPHGVKDASLGNFAVFAFASRSDFVVPPRFRLRYRSFRNYILPKIRIDRLLVRSPAIPNILPAESSLGYFDSVRCANSLLSRLVTPRSLFALVVSPGISDNKKT